MKQWHPVFAQLLRPAVEGFYEVQTGLPVGDVPREADFVLLRRTASEPPPFRGLWRHLTTWNILEFKGPTVSPRRDDVGTLVELGLGIHRRLQAERLKQRQKRMRTEEVSFWYLTNRLGQRFLRTAEQQLGTLEPLGAGLWRCRILERLLFLVSSSDLPVEADSLPLHVVGREPMEVERQVAQLVFGEFNLQKQYGGWMAALHPAAWKEMEIMARALGKRLAFDLRPAIEYLGLNQVLEQVGVDRVIEEVGIDRVIEKAGIERVIQEVGIDRVIEELGEKQLIRRIGLDRLLANLTPADRRELKRRLDG